MELSIVENHKVTDKVQLVWLDRSVEFSTVNDRALLITKT